MAFLAADGIQFGECVGRQFQGGAGDVLAHSTEDVPGMSSTFGERCSSQASAADNGVVSSVWRPCGGYPVALAWRRSGGPAPTGYAVYRVDAPDGNAVLIGTVRATGDDAQRWTDTTAAPGRRYTYCVTAVDRSANQSGAGAPRTVT